MNYNVYKVNSSTYELEMYEEPADGEDDENKKYVFADINEMVNFARHMYNLVHNKESRPTRRNKRFEKVMICEEIFESLTRLANSLSDLVKTKKQPNFNRLILFHRGAMPDNDDEYFKCVLKKLFDNWNDIDMDSEICIEIVEID